MEIKDSNQFIDMIAQAVVDRIEEREQINQFVNAIIQRVMEFQAEARAAAASNSDALPIVETVDAPLDSEN